MSRSISPRPTTWLALAALILLCFPARAQQPGDALVSSDAQSLISIDLTTGAMTTLPGSPIDLLAITRFAEEPSGDIVFTALSNVRRLMLPSGVVTPVSGITEGLFTPRGIDVDPAGGIFVTDVQLFASAAFAIDPTDGTAVSAVDPIPGAAAGGESSFDIAVDDFGNLFISYNSILFENPPAQVSAIVRVASGSTAPTILADNSSGPASGQSFLFLAYDPMADRLVVATDENDLFFVDPDSGATSFLSAGGSLTDIQGVTFDVNGDVLAIDVNSGIVRVTPGGAQSVVPNSVVSQPSGIIVYAPEPGLGTGLILAGACLGLLGRRRFRPRTSALPG